VEFIDEPDLQFNSAGAKGVGEVSLTGVAPAIANAVFHATGVASATFHPDRTFALKMGRKLRHTAVANSTPHMALGAGEGLAPSAPMIKSAKPSPLTSPALATE